MSWRPPLRRLLVAGRRRFSIAVALGAAGHSWVMSSWTAGDFDYDTLGGGYTGVRRPDDRIAAQIVSALGNARSVLNIGAGAGSYEPTDRFVVPVEPSATMRAQRPPHLAPAIEAVAEALPFDAAVFDAAMAVLTVHHWPDAGAGLGELRRVTRGPVVILTFDGPALERFWLNDYAPSSSRWSGAATRRSPRSAAPSAAPAPSMSSRSRSIARTGSAMHSTDGRSDFSIPQSGRHSRDGGSSMTGPSAGPSTRSVPISSPASGTTDTATCAHSPPTTVPFV